MGEDRWGGMEADAGVGWMEREKERGSHGYHYSLRCWI